MASETLDHLTPSHEPSTSLSDDRFWESFMEEPTGGLMYLNDGEVGQESQSQNTPAELDQSIFSADDYVTTSFEPSSTEVYVLVDSPGFHASTSGSSGIAGSSAPEASSIGLDPHTPSPLPQGDNQDPQGSELAAIATTDKGKSRALQPIESINPSLLSNIAPMPVVLPARSSYDSYLPSRPSSNSALENISVEMLQNPQFVPQLQPPNGGTQHIPLAHQYGMTSVGAARTNPRRASRIYTPYPSQSNASSVLQPVNQVAHGRTMSQLWETAPAPRLSRAETYPGPQAGGIPQHLYHATSSSTHNITYVPPSSSQYIRAEPGPSHRPATPVPFISHPTTVEDQVWLCTSRFSPSGISYKLWQRLEPMLVEPLLKSLLQNADIASRTPRIPLQHFTVSNPTYTVSSTGTREPVGPVELRLHLSPYTAPDIERKNGEKPGTMFVGSMVVTHEFQPLILEPWRPIDPKLLRDLQDLRLPVNLNIPLFEYTGTTN